jgi:hypothetical protein
MVHLLYSSESFVVFLSPSTQIPQQYLNQAMTAPPFDMPWSGTMEAQTNSNKGSCECGNGPSWFPKGLLAIAKGRQDSAIHTAHTIAAALLAFTHKPIYVDCAVRQAPVRDPLSSLPICILMLFCCLKRGTGSVSISGAPVTEHKQYLHIQSVPHRKHITSPLQSPTG